MSKEEKKTFAIVPKELTRVPAEVLESVADEDWDGYEEPVQTFPIVSIRQKEVKDETGNILQIPGGFRYRDPAGVDVPDMDGQEGLTVTILMDSPARIYWPDLSTEKPDCQSRDGHTGQGSPGGQCTGCEYSKWPDGGGAPPCKEHKNLMCWDHKLRTGYLLDLGPSGLRPYSNLKSILARSGKADNLKKRSGLPLVYVQVHVQVSYKATPKPHYIPAFGEIELLDEPTRNQMKEYRKQIVAAFNKTATVEVEKAESGEISKDDTLPF